MGWTTCWKCEERFGLDDATEAVLRKSGRGFCCPWGHSAVFPLGESETDKLARELKAANATVERELRWREESTATARTLEKRQSAQRGVTTRLKNRVANGVCPCCNRTFVNLQRHMSTKHAGFVAEDVQAEVGQTIQ